MKTKKSILCLILCLCAMFAVFPATAAAEVGTVAPDIGLTQEEKAYIQAHPEVHLLIIPGIEPLEYLDADGVPAGITVAMHEHFAWLTGLRFSYVTAKQADEVRSLIEKGDADIISCLSYPYTETLFPDFTCTEPFLHCNTVLFANDSLGELDDLNGRIFAATRGGTVPEGVDPENVKYYNTRNETILAVHNGEADYGYGNEFSVSFYVAQEGMHNLIVIPTRQEGRSYCMAYQSIDPLLASILNKAIQSLTEEDMRTILLRGVASVQPSLTVNEVVQAFGDEITVLLASVLALFALFITLWQRAKTRSLQREAENAHLLSEQFRIVAKQSGRNVFRCDVKTGAASQSGESPALLAIPQTCENVEDTLIRSGVIAPESMAAYKSFFRRIRSGESPVTADILMQQTDGTRRWFRHIATTLFDEAGKPETAIISYCDYTEQREQAMAYEKWRQELEDTPFEDTALYEWNLTRDACDGARGALVTAYDEAIAGKFDARTKAFVEKWVYKDDQVAFANLMDRKRLLGRYFSGENRDTLEYRYVMEDGSNRWRRITVQLVHYPDSQDIKAYVTHQDIDEEKREELSLLAQAQQDSLTGVLNRETFVTRVKALFTRAPAANHVVMLMDIDDFKHINDEFGHATGDMALIDFAAQLQRTLRADDIIGRVGGDEFMVCLPNMTSDGVIRRKAQLLCTALHKTLEGRVPINVSIGVAVYPRDGESFETLYRNADCALYYTKNHGKNNYNFYKDWMKENGKA
ncbi:MAG: diguanylate cyclase [Clostridia bacterium]|nr:diguanylate cyclase [Clostridia bacterium]